MPGYLDFTVEILKLLLEKYDGSVGIYDLPSIFLERNKEKTSYRTSNKGSRGG